MGILLYKTDNRNGKIKVIRKKDALLKALVERHLLDTKTRKALKMIDTLPKNYPAASTKTGESILRVKAAADLVFGKDNPQGFLHVLFNPHEIRANNRTSIRKTRIAIEYGVRKVLSNPEFLKNLKKGQIIKRIPESLRYLLWVGRVAKIVPVDGKTQKVVWVSKDAARAWAEFFEKHRKKIFEGRGRKQ